MVQISIRESSANNFETVTFHDGRTPGTTKIPWLKKKRKNQQARGRYVLMRKVESSVRFAKEERGWFERDVSDREERKRLQEERTERKRENERERGRERERGTKEETKRGRKRIKKKEETVRCGVWK